VTTLFRLRHHHSFAACLVAASTALLVWLRATNASAEAPHENSAPVVIELPVEKTVAPAASPLAITDLDQLADVTRSDPVVGPRAAYLRDRKQSSRASAGLGSVLGGLLVGGSLLVGGTELQGDVVERTAVSVPMLISGLAVVALGWTGYWLFWPGDEAVDQVGRDWNERHPDRLLRLSP
jgi:hypothetical protein